MARKTKNVPTDKALYSRVKAAAKKKFKVYPCVPVEGSEALTRKGWKAFGEVVVGEDIVAYDRSSDCLVWSEVIALHHHEDAPLLRMHKANTCFDFVCTPDHRWVIRPRASSAFRSSVRRAKYPDQMVPASNLTQSMEIITSARMVDGPPADLRGFRKNKWSWVEQVLAMSNEQREAWLAAAVVYDGHENNYSDRYDRGSYGFSQKNQDHADATAICAALLGYNVSFKRKKSNPLITSFTFIDRQTHRTQNVIIDNIEDGEVWCPETSHGTWLMRQKRMVTITGNSAYANGWVVQEYKRRGGKYKKASVKVGGRD